jgi:hypothetical protein
LRLNPPDAYCAAYISSIQALEALQQKTQMEAQIKSLKADLEKANTSLSAASSVKVRSRPYCSFY